jgi:hypothetical protein
MSVGHAKIEERKEAMKTWQVNYNATYWVEAETEDEAIDLGMEKHSELPDGSWEAMIDPWEN